MIFKLPVIVVNRQFIIFVYETIRQLCRFAF